MLPFQLAIIEGNPLFLRHISASASLALTPFKMGVAAKAIGMLSFL